MFIQGLDARERAHRADARVFLKQFVIGRAFDSPVKLKRLMPAAENLYAFRISFEPKHRILGGFLGPGEFVATAHRSRSTLASETWAPTRTVAKRVWRELFPSVPRCGHNLSDLLVDFG